MRLNDGRVIPAFIGQALRGEDLTILATVCKRSFVMSMIRWKVYLDCCIQTMYPINIGNPDEITIKDFADEIIKLTGTNQKWFIFLYQSMILCNDNQTLQKARELLGGKLK
jgi:dTDP-glucose 4,6-dehydratase